jgi:DNA polymerase I-like protein with 3'-5' exonuclease and polymerase domains
MEPINLLHLGTQEDADSQHRLTTLHPGVQVRWKSKLSTPATITDLERQCLQVPGGIRGIVCSNQEFLEKLLYAQPDFLPPNNRRGLTLDDYQGSLLFTPREKIPVVFINPLKNLVTVPHATPAAQRFVSKLTKPEKWYVPTKFTWALATPENLPEIFARWEKSARLIAVDIETNVDDPNRTINCIGFAAYFPDSHSSECLVIPFKDAFFLSWIRKFNNLPQPKIFQNGLYDNVYLARYNCLPYNWLYDTQHLFHSMFSEYPKRLDFISAFAIREIRYWKDDGKSGNLQDYYRYNARDCWATLNSLLSLVLDAEPYAIRNYLKEFPLVFPCLHCELEGLKIDTDRLKVVKKKAEEDLVVREQKFQKMIAAPNFNVGSWQQVQQLMKVCGLSSIKGTGKAELLVAQASTPLNNRIFTEVQEIRQDRKLVSTYYVEGKFWNGRLYYKLNPAGTDTGRLASSESSFWCGLQIQNIPRGDSVKQCIVSDPGWLLCEIDKAQSEARCVGYLSGETKLIELVESSHDYHSWNAAAFFGVPYESIYDEATGKKKDTELRDLSKRTNHGANYNMGDTVMLQTMGPKNVARAKAKLKLPSFMSLKKVCAHLLDVYDKTYPRVRGLGYDAIIKEITLTGRLVSPRGWTRIFFGKPSRANKPLLNAAVAHPPQNLSVDIINEEFYNVWRASIYGSFYKAGKEILCNLVNRLRLKAQIHDSIFFQYRQDNHEVPTIVATQIMNTRVTIRGADGVTRELYIPSDISAGKDRWSALK